MKWKQAKMPSCQVVPSLPTSHSLRCGLMRQIKSVTEGEKKKNTQQPMSSLSSECPVSELLLLMISHHHSHQNVIPLSSRSLHPRAFLALKTYRSEGSFGSRKQPFASGAEARKHSFSLSVKQFEGKRLVFKSSQRNHIATELNGEPTQMVLRFSSQCASLALEFWISPEITLLLAQGFMSLGLCIPSEWDFLFFLFSFSSHFSLCPSIDKEL